ncbi:hypothetical protein [Arcobacter sp.]|uniref:hypothetical protein n=1 Tax=Arcobacter sp. TaxID=1872629 RepID=UPI003D1362AB
MTTIIKKITLVEYILFFIYLCIILVGLKEFIIWNQITDLLNGDNFNKRFEVLLSLYKTGHPHALRVTLLYPILEFVRLMNVDENFFFSLILFILLFCTYRLVKKILNNLGINKTLPILLFLFFLSYFMNGRIIFAIFGNTLILFALFSYEWNNISKLKLMGFLTIGAFFTSVSSGTFSVALVTILLFYFLSFLAYFPIIKKKYFGIYMFLLVFFLSSFPFIALLFIKNLNYYNGSIINMLNHGYGKIFLINHYFIILLSYMVCLMSILLLYISKRYRIYIFSLSQVFASVLVGLFGYTAFLSGIMAYILLFYMLINKNIINRICQ